MKPPWECENWLFEADRINRPREDCDLIAIQMFDNGGIVAYGRLLDALKEDWKQRNAQHEQSIN